MSKRLYLSDTDRKIGGMCGGLAEYFGVDTVIIRLVWGAAILIYGTGLMLYLLFWIVVPRKRV